MIKPKDYKYRDCEVVRERVSNSILVGCNGSINRYLREFWRVIFPDNTWIRVGTKLQARQYIDANIGRHGVEDKVFSYPTEGFIRVNSQNTVVAAHA